MTQESTGYVCNVCSRLIQKHEALWECQHCHRRFHEGHGVKHPPGDARSRFKLSDLPLGIDEQTEGWGSPPTRIAPEVDRAAGDSPSGGHGFWCDACSNRQNPQKEMDELLSLRETMNYIHEKDRGSFKALQDELASVKSEVESLTKRSRPLISVGWVYVGMFLFAIVVTGLLVWRGWAERPDVSIEYNVGEIIGGILAGAGVAAAGAAYALKTMRGGE
jgi:hypothetical protein